VVAAIIAMLEAYGLPTTIPPELDRAQIRRYLQADKKSIGGRVFFVLPEAIGRVRITDQVDPADLEAVLAAS
jgi:3-dehydroquinate synthase